MAEQTYKVWAENLPKLTATMERLNRRAAKLGCSTLRFDVFAGYDVKVRRGDKSFVVKTQHQVVVGGETPKLAGWSFVGGISHVTTDAGEARSVVRAIPGFDIPTWFRDSTASNCDQCHTIRRRTDTFLVQSDAGEWRQVGRNCLADFLGGQDPHAAAAMAELLFAIASACGDAEVDGFGCNRDDRIDLHEFVALCAGCIRLNGWTSRGKARGAGDGARATVDQALEVLAAIENGKLERADAVTAEDIALATAALDRVQEKLAGRNDLEDYLYNLCTACSCSLLPFKLTGIAGSVISWYQREIGYEAEQKAALAGVNNTYFGTVGKRESYYLTPTNLRVLDGIYGATYFYTFRDREGRPATWFASSNPDLALGTEYLVAGTVKKQDQYRGLCQTQLSRCTVYTDEGRALEEAKQAKRAAKAAKKALTAAPVATTL